eukprot:779551_1
MPSVFLWFVLLSHQMLVPAQAQTMNGSSFSCTGYQECLNTSIQCNDDQDCFVACAGSNACSTANISAPSNANLFVECSTHRSCMYANIYGPSIGNMNVNCTAGSDGCWHATIHGPANGDLTVICGGTGSYTHRLCYGMRIYCPIYGECDAQCLDGNQYDCWSFRLDAQSMINGTLTLHSVSGIGGSSYVRCPGNDTKCIISCESSGSGGCESATIYTKPDTKLFITAVGTNALKNTRVYCPSGNGVC